MTLLNLGKDYIQNVIENILGFKNDDEFKKFYDDRLTNGTTDEEISLLDPKNIDGKAFWDYIDTNFNRSVCGAFNASKENADDLNLMLHKHILDFHRVMENIGGRDVLEIGPGYGNIYKELGKYSKSYRLLDVAPKFDKVESFDGWNLPTDKRYDFIFSLNVFQHLSVEQRKYLLKQIFNLLNDNGNFLVTHQDNHSQPNFIKHNSKQYMCHYGQFTEIQSLNDNCQNLADCGFYILNNNRRFDGYMSSFCSKINTNKELSNDTSN